MLGLIVTIVVVGLIAGALARLLVPGRQDMSVPMTILLGILGSLLGVTSPVPTHTPLLGAELLLDAGSALDADVDAEFEHGVLVDTGVATVDGTEVKQGELAFTAPGRTTLRLVAGAEPVRLLLLGGPPFGESIVMWWNFVGRTHEEVVGYREEWMAQLVDGGLVDGRFGVPVEDPLPPIPAPELPNARLRERR